MIPVKEVIPVENDTEIDIDNLDIETEMEDEEVVATVPEEKEENRIVTLLSMPSRKVKIKISKELLEELERMQLNFKLN